MSKSVLANKIGYSLFEVAKENNSLEQVSYELNEVAKVINENSDFVTLMNNPNIEKIKKINLIDASFSGVNKYVVNVVKILAGNLQISLINFVLEQFTELFNRYSNSVVVKVESASPLTELQLENLKEKLKNELQLEKVELNNFVDESLLGGFKLTYNNKVVDASIKAKLSAIKAKISTI
ncbi:F-type ATPase subunit delta [Gemella morbillorum]|jgi:ATP synthase F1, delta subunit|uniref:ATP synthase subunit delta n=1 Tax=Gemella morbillorum TaxID=29391 RepID=A0A2X4R085_9BACL|nr:ATP synthase F1 subunit delta [Gemella morbillorum]QGS08818.1 ATP synthase F1 subunit delta [Gemella morbillorum]UBH81120.1 ATP synthase F1 subunit delta [Gemella morbillorum]SQH54882.1 F-type ATPase subunit delta [Gemella morbillorum]